MDNFCRGRKRWASSHDLVLILVFGLCSFPLIGGAFEARDTVQKGTVEFGVLGGFWKGNNIFDNAPSKNRKAIYILPQWGVVLTDEAQAGWLSGNLEFLFEPLAAHYYEPFSASAFGASLVLKYNFTSFGRFMPFWDMGAGVMWTDLAPRIPEQSTQFEFVLETGPGLHYFLTEQLALTGGFRFHHISNSGIGRRNIGLNAWLFNFGFSFFVP